MTTDQDFFAGCHGEWSSGQDLTKLYEQIRPLYLAGKNYDEIAAELGTNRSQVNRILIKMFADGLPRRPRKVVPV